MAAGSEPQPVVVVPRWEALGSPGGEKVGGESRLLSALPAPPGASGGGRTNAEGWETPALVLLPELLEGLRGAEAQLGGA